MLTKIFSVEQIREADKYTIDNEPIKSIDLMERAAKECFIWLSKKALINQEFDIFCGPGNNGGDGLVIARLLINAGYIVHVFVVDLSGRFSEDFGKSLTRLKKKSNCKIKYLTNDIHDFGPFSDQSIIVDAIFGSGLTKELKGLPKVIVKRINDLPNIKVAIDIPSGLFADRSSILTQEIIFKADYTLSFQFPKLAFLFPENDIYVGNWQVLDIGLLNEYIDHTETLHYFLNKSFVSSLLKVRRKYAHKGDFGHVLMIAGDETKFGAALLSSKAALRAGAGLVSLHHPSSLKGLVSLAIPEIMSSIDKSDIAFTELPELSKYSHIAIGPGIGTRAQTAKALKSLLQQVNTPLVLDADAINILAENRTWLSFLPKGSILTPHIGEFTRLIGKVKNDFERLEKTKDFAKKYGVYMILKGAHTIITTPNRRVFFNSTGNPGMATGGSGDVLTGIIIGLLAQKYSPIDAAILAVYLHGLSGNIAAENNHLESVIASDIIDHLGKAYQKLKT